jgi:hypothetical protein
MMRDHGFSLIANHSGLVLDVAGNGATDVGAPLEQNNYDGSSDMKWQFEEVSGGTVGLQPYGQPGAYLSRVGATAQAVSGANAAGQWRLVPGLADPSCVTFELLAEPGVYLRHSNYLLWVDATDNTVGFFQDATFCFRDGLSATGFNLHGLESLNYPGYYVTTPSGGQAALEPLVDAADFYARATWILAGT